MFKRSFKYSLLFLLLLLLPSGLSAQKKQLSQAKDYIKSGKNLDKAESLVRAVLADSAEKDNLKAWQMLVETLRKQYEQGNEQMYLKQKYDTLSFFVTTRKLFVAAESADSVDAEPDRNGRIKPKYRERNSQYLKTIMPNIFYGGLFFINKKEYRTAYQYFNHYLSLPKLPLFKSLKLPADNDMMISAAYWTMYCGFKLDSAKIILEHSKLAERDTSQLAFVWQYEAEAYSLNRDMPKYLSKLRDGFNRYPKFPFFFPRLIEYYDDNNQLDSALALTEKAIAIDSASHFYRYAKSSVLLNMGRYDECIKVCKELIAEDDNLADAYYNAGLAYFNMAVELDKDRKAARQKRQKMLMYYREALPFLEKYRSLAPDRKENWLSPLYTIYLNLNMGKKFEEIDKIRNEYKRNNQ